MEHPAGATIISIPLGTETPRGIQSSDGSSPERTFSSNLVEGGAASGSTIYIELPQG